MLKSNGLNFLELNQPSKSLVHTNYKRAGFDVLPTKKIFTFR